MYVLTWIISFTLKFRHIMKHSFTISGRSWILSNLFFPSKYEGQDYKY